MPAILSFLTLPFPLWRALCRGYCPHKTMDFFHFSKYSNIRISPSKLWLSVPFYSTLLFFFFFFLSHPVMRAHRAPISDKTLNWRQPGKWNKKSGGASKGLYKTGLKVQTLSEGYQSLHGRRERSATHYSSSGTVGRQQRAAKMKIIQPTVTYFLLKSWPPRILKVMDRIVYFGPMKCSHL